MRTRRPERVLVICNGASPSRRLVRGLAALADRVIAADGGANTARARGVRLDAIIGDLDSVLPSTLRHFRTSAVLRVARQDNTDLEKVLDVLAREGYKDVVVIGAEGGRLDFTLANLAVLWKYVNRLGVTFRGDGWQAKPVGRTLVGTAVRGTTASLIPFGRCSGITLRGFRYGLTSAAMGAGDVGVSNVVVASPFSIRVRKGRMLLILLDRSVRRRGSIRW
jgi:thiamine pyrophosphokinase